MVLSQKFNLVDVLEKNENCSDIRAIFIEHQQMVAINFKFEEEHAFELFHKLPVEFLPQLPKAYQWVKANGRYGIIRHQHSVEHVIEILIYGPDKNGSINFLCRCDQVTFYSFAHVQKNGFPAQRDYPLKSQDYKVGAYNYATARFNNHIRGHMIDHHDTIATQWNSSKDISNYTPEPPDYAWGMGIRRLATHHLRSLKNGGVYAQYNQYGAQPLQTANATLVPDRVRFFTYQALKSFNPLTQKKLTSYQQLDLFHVSFSEDLKKTTAGKILDHARNNFCSDWESVPVIKVYKPQLTDLELRQRAQDMIEQTSQVLNGEIMSRFVNQDHYDLLCISGDYEFDNCSQRLSAAIASNAHGYRLHTFNYCKSSLAYAQALLKLDRVTPSKILDENIKTQAHSFFQQATDPQILELADQFKQLCAN
ncbi:MAG: hypothetical protein EBY16_08270 [Gammaproteobacteria bacterium]|nr:hypothetical protein [Gammaproteobacteria bacterium]